MRYWLAHTRGCDFARLRDLGFLTLYPALDDYVFLAATDKNKVFLRRQTELGIRFLRQGDQYQTVSQKEINAMQGQTVDKIEPGTEIVVLQGFASALEGTVQERNGNKLRCLLGGLTRNYDVLIDVLDVVRKKEESDA